MNAVYLSVIAIGLTGIAHYFADIATLRTVALFLGLEGTALLASALSPPPPELREKEPGNPYLRVRWHFTEGRGLRYPIGYNPLCYYSGLLMLAASMMISALSD